MTAADATAGRTRDPAAGDAREARAAYAHFLAIPTRWMDNDTYGHVNNVVYYSYFDTVINEYLIRAGGLDIHDGAIIGLAIETHCKFHAPLSFPETIDAGLRVRRLGNSSVRYEIGLYRRDDTTPAATGYFVHVFVDRATRRPTAMPPGIRAALERLVVA
jgi:acyl-CoA thioester hydrolase